MAAEQPHVHERTLVRNERPLRHVSQNFRISRYQRWQPQMGHFQADQEGNWWFLTVGKGNKEREISVSDAMLEALKRYRLSRGLSSLPMPGESSSSSSQDTR